MSVLALRGYVHQSYNSTKRCQKLTFVFLLSSTESQHLSLSKRPLTNIYLIQSFKYSYVKDFLLHTYSLKCSFIHFGRWLYFPICNFSIISFWEVTSFCSVTLLQRPHPTSHCPTASQHLVIGLGGEDPLEQEMVTYSSILAWRIQWREESGGLQSVGSQRFVQD